MAKHANITDGFHRARLPIQVTLNQPTTAGTKTITGTLLGAMHDRGALLHYRVSVGGNMCYLAPPSWLHPDSRVAAVRAGLTVPEHMLRGMWVATIDRLTEQWADVPEGAL